MDGIANLYDAISTRFDIGTLDDFRKKIANDNHRRNLYDAISNQFDLGVKDFDEFSHKIQGYLNQSISAVPIEFTEQRSSKPNAQEQRMMDAVMQHAPEQGSISEEQARQTYQNVHDQGEQYIHDLRYRNGEDGPKDSYAKDFEEGLMAGLGSVAQLPYKAIGAFEDWGSGLMQKATFNGFGGRYNFATNGNGIARRFFNDVLGGNYFKERTEHYKKEADRYQDNKGILESAFEGDYSKALGKLGISSLENAPNLIVSIALASMGAPELAASTLAGGAAFDKWEEVQNDKNLSDDDKAVAVLGTFLAEYIFEKIGDVRYQKMFQTGQGAQARRELVRGAKNAWQKLYNSKVSQAAGKVWNKIMQFGGESLTEMATDVAEQSIDVYLGKQDGIDWKQVGDAGIVALASDAPVQGTHWAIDTKHRRKLTSEIASNKQLTELAVSFGMQPDQMADLLVRAGHGEELSEAEYNAVQAYSAGAKEIIANMPKTEEPEAEEAKPAETETPTPTETPSPTKPIKGKRETAHPVNVVIDGVEQTVTFSGTNVVYNEDGSIDHEHSGKIYLQDADGNIIPGSQHESILEAIDNTLRTEKENGEELEKNDQPIVETPATEEPAVEEPVDTRTPEQIAADEAAAAEQAEQQRIQDMSAALDQQLQEKGDKVMDSWTPEESFIYTMTHSSLEDAVADAQEAMETAKTDKNPTRRRKRMQEIQSVLDKYVPKDQTKQEPEQPIQPEQPVVQTNPIPEPVQQEQPVAQEAQEEEPIKDGPTGEAPVGEQATTETPVSESVNLSDPDIVLTYRQSGKDYQFARKSEDGKLISLESGKELNPEIWKEKDKTIVIVNGVKYYMISGINAGTSTVNVVPIETTMPVVTLRKVAGVKGDSVETVDKKIVMKEDGTPLFKSSEENRNPEYAALLKNAKSINDLMEYVVFSYNKDGQTVNITLRDLLNMFSRPNDRMDRVPVTESKYGEKLGELLERVGKSEADKTYLERDYLLPKLADVINVWNKITTNPSDKINKMPVTVFQRMRTLINKINDKTIIDDAGMRVGDYFSGPVDESLREKYKNTAKKSSKKRPYTPEDLAKRQRLKETLKNDKALTEEQREKLKKQAFDLESTVDFTTPAKVVEEPKEKTKRPFTKEDAERFRELSERVRDGFESDEEENDIRTQITEMLDTIDFNTPAKTEKAPKPVVQEPETPAQKRKATAKDIEDLSGLMRELKEAEAEEDFDEVAALNQEIAKLHEQVEFNVGNIEVNEDAGRRAVEYLQSKGVDITEISDEEAEQMIGDEKAEQLRNSKGVLYGLAVNGKVYVIGSKLNPNTPVHEYTHLWVKDFKKANPKKWAEIVKVLKQTQQWNDVITDENYSNIKDNADAVASEVLARLSGDYWGQVDENGKSRLDDAINDKALLVRVRSALRSLWKYVCSRFGKDVNLRDKDADAQLQEIIRKPIENLMEKKMTLFDEKFKKVREKLDKGGENVLSLQEITELTNTLQDDIRQGNRPLVFERIPYEALQSGIGNQRTLAEALTIVALRSRRTRRALVRDGREVGSDEIASRDASETAMLLDLVRYAKEKGIWVEDVVDALDEQYGKENRVSVITGKKSGESEVWIDSENSRVIKAKADNYYESMEEFLEGMILNNWIFGDNQQVIVGFGIDRRENRDAIRVIFETPLVNIEEATPLTQDEKNAFMADYGFSYVEGGRVYSETEKGEGSLYTNGKFEVRDLHSMNIVRDEDGNIRCIDPIIKWAEGEHYSLPTEEQEQRDAENEEALDALFEGDGEFMIGSPDPRNIDASVKDAMEKRKEQVQDKNENVHTKPAERLEGTAKLIYQIFDNTHGLYLLQKKINEWRKQHGKGPIPDGMDVRSLLNRCSSAIASRVTLFDQRQGAKLKQITDKIAEKIAGSSLMNRFQQDLLEEEDSKGNTFHYSPTAKDLLERYLIARDNVERAEMGIPTRGEREFTERMGMSMAEYATLFQDQLTDEELKELWDAVRDCTNTSLQELLRGERISQEDYDTYKQRLFYVPEKDFAERETNDELQKDDDARKGGRNRQATAVAHKAEGGNSLATNILANIVHDAKNSIAVAQENLVRKAMYDLMNDNLDYVDEYGIPRPTQVWFVKVGTTDSGEPIYQRATERPSQDMFDEAELIRTLINEQQERLKKEKDKDKRDKIKEAISLLKKDFPIVSAKQANDNSQLADSREDVPSVKVYVDGIQYEMTFEGMQEVADALNGVYDLLGNDSIVRKANGFIASLCTTYNPTFFAVNIARDTPYILSKGYSQYGIEFVHKFGKALTTDGVNTRRPILQYLSGRLNENTPEGRLFYNFLMGGGNTGYTQLKNIREIKEEFEKSGFGRTGIGKLFDVGAKLNEYSELLTRFAAYKAMIESGYSENEALNAAKNLSVNFNRRGAGNKFINWFNSLSMFSNAAIQGASGFFRSFDSPKRTARAFFGMCFAPAFLGFMNTLLCPDDDDDEYVVSDYYRDNYLVLGPVKIPIAQEFKPFFAIGVNIAMGMQGRRDAGQIAKSIIQSFTLNLLPVPPAVSQAMVKAEGIIAGDSEGFSDFADVASNLMLPQFANNVQEISNNKDFMGNTIRKYDLGVIPQYKLGENEAALYKDIAKLFYLASGGDTKVPSKFKKGSIDEEIAININPKEVRKAIGIIVPSGWLDVISSIYGFGLANNVSWSEGEGRVQDLPIVHSFYRPEDETMFRYTLYKEMKRITTNYDNIVKEVKKQYKGGDDETREAIEAEVMSKMTNASERGFNPVYWKQLEDAYKATSVYDIAHKLGKTEDELRKQYPELDNLEDFQKMIAKQMNEQLMEYHGIEHHIPWLQEKMRFWDRKK